MTVSTAFSDLVLAIVTLYGIVQLIDPSYSQFPFALVGYSVIWLGAAFGIIRFIVSNPPCIVIQVHRAFTWLGATVGLALITAQMYYKSGMDEIGHIHLISGMLLLIIKLISDYRTSTTMSEFVSAVSVLSILLNNLLNQSVYGCLGALSIVLVGLVVGTQGRRIGMPSVDVFHYGLSIGLYCFMKAIKEAKQEELI